MGHGDTDLEIEMKKLSQYSTES